MPRQSALSNCRNGLARIFASTQIERAGVANCGAEEEKQEKRKTVGGIDFAQMPEM